MCTFPYIPFCCIVPEPLITQEVVPLARAPIPPPARVRHTEARRGSLALAWEPPTMPEPKYRVKSYIIERDDVKY